MGSPKDTERGSITLLLEKVAKGNNEAIDQIWSDLHSEIHSIAKRIMAGESPSPTLQPTLLIQESYLKLFGGKVPEFKSSTHLLSLISISMERYLIDRDRHRKAKKRGGDKQRCSLTIAVGELSPFKTADTFEGTLARNALKKLRKIKPQEADIAEFRFCRGLTVEETAAATGLSTRTVKNKWAHARAWLSRELDKRDGDE